MATLKCNNCGKSVKANEELKNYTETPDEPVIVWELTARCGCGAKLKEWKPLTPSEILEGLAAYSAYAKASVEMPAVRDAAQRKVWEVEGF